MIIKKINEVNKKIKEKIESYKEEINITGFVCPKCESKEYIYYGRYERNIIYYEYGKIQEKKLEIRRIMCKSCKKTHAVIPDFLVPYKVYIIDTIIDVLEKETKISKKEIERKMKISRQIVLKWKKRFKEYISKLYVMYGIYKEKEIIKKIKREENIIRKYYLEYKEILMMGREVEFYRYITT